MTLLSWQRGGRTGGPAVVLLHAWARTGAGDWEDTGWVGRLGAAGFDVLVPDVPGHGGSADVGVPADADSAGWSAGVLCADLDRLGVGALAVAGFAEGCLVAAHLAVAEPERVGALALLGADDRAGVPHGREIAGALRDPDARVWHPEAAEAVSRARRARTHHLPTLAVWAERASWPAAPRLGALRTPVLVAVGAGDERRTRTPRLAALFHDARLVTATGEGAALLSAPELLDTVTRFLTDHAGAVP